MGVYIRDDNYSDYSAMQGPAPSGFHVPLSSEWGTLCGILTTTFGLAKNATTIGTYLKMPMAGYRNTYANVSSVGTSGRYWSSFPNAVNNAHLLYFYSSNIITNYGQSRANGNSVRCFKDAPIIPTSSWTTLYDGSSVASGAGVFYNASLGLISVSGDGNTWYTIMDKNLGATTVFNQGDTVNDANSGYFYQWGNNYGFPHSGSVTTSSTKVDASNYGPGNYYNSSTFITGSGDWSSVQNDNLWGGTTGVNHMSELKNAYIGQGIWKPGANTIAYYPLTSTSTTSDMSGNGYTLTQNGNSDFGTYLGVDCVYVHGSDGSGFKCLTTQSINNSVLGNSFTLVFWGARDTNIGCAFGGINGSWNGLNYGSSNSNIQMEVLLNGSINKLQSTPTTTVQQRNLYTAVYDNGSEKGYIDGNVVVSGNYTVGAINILGVGCGFGTESSGYIYQNNGYLSNVIIENKARTAQEISDYYNLTKANYGL